MSKNYFENHKKEKRVREIKNKLYRVKTNISQKVKFYECENEKDLIRHIYYNHKGEPVSVSEILKNGKTSKVKIYTSDYYKNLKKTTNFKIAETNDSWIEKCNKYIKNHIKEFYKDFYEVKLTPTKSGYMVNPCPICGHKDCATIIDEKPRCNSCNLLGDNFVYIYLKYNESNDIEDNIRRIERFCKVMHPNISENKRVKLKK